MDDLVEFLRARIAEDEAVARAATDGPWTAWEGRELHGLGDLIHPVRTPGQMAGSRATIVTASWLDAEHIARFANPDRVLAEAEAKRRIIGNHVADKKGHCRCCAHWTSDWVDGYKVDRLSYGGVRAPCLTLRLLALPFAGHPDYRPEWAPEGSSSG